MPSVHEAYQEEYDGVYEEEYDGVYEEAFQPSPVVTARPQAPPQRPNGRPVTQAQLQMAITRLNADNATNSRAIQRVNRSVTTLGRDVRRQTAGMRDTKKDIGQLRDALIILPLLAGSLGNRTLATLFPFLLLQGVGETRPEGSSSSGGGLFGGGDSSMSSLLPVLLLSGALGGTTGGGTP